ncbi:hypothetical protein DV515_00011895 [Chloebia gouldiae]|uniref:Uncharacterized protein n=1 Tax=Chloebia gouldiae TaxID=44316 RepID=A0A3L8S6A4_CHLGU|nr:hypothetical protein DV515_00011895 [Chloebia gouldiae]
MQCVRHKSDHGHRVRSGRGDDGVVGRDCDGGAILCHHGDGVADGLHVCLGYVHLQHTAAPEAGKGLTAAQATALIPSASLTGIYQLMTRPDAKHVGKQQGCRANPTQQQTLH